MLTYTLVFKKRNFINTTIEYKVLRERRPTRLTARQDLTLFPGGWKGEPAIYVQRQAEYMLKHTITVT